MIKNYLIKGCFICIALLTFTFIVDYKVEERITFIQKISYNQTR